MSAQNKPLILLNTTSGPIQGDCHGDASKSQVLDLAQKSPGNDSDFLNLYGKHLRFDFETRLRDEVKFESVEALKLQIARDCENARSLLHAQYE